MNKTQKLVGSFDIPEELAKELSELLTKQTIRTNMLLQVLDDTDKYENIENKLIPITSRIEAIKIRITNEFVPAEFNSMRYVWNYDGWEVAGTTVNVFETVYQN